MTDTIQTQAQIVKERLETAIARKLREGEEIVWQGRKLARFEARGCLIYVVAVPWTGFSLLWIFLALLGVFEEGQGLFGTLAALFAIPFLLVGLAMLARPFLSFFQRGRVMFAITNRRVLKASLGRELKVISVPESRIKTATLRESSDGTGSIDLTLSHQIKAFGGRKTRKLMLGRVNRIAAADAAMAQLLGEAAFDEEG